MGNRNEGNSTMKLWKGEKISYNWFFSAHTEFQICIGNQNFHEIRT